MTGCECRPKTVDPLDTRCVRKDLDEWGAEPLLCRPMTHSGKMRKRTPRKLVPVQNSPHSHLLAPPLADMMRPRTPLTPISISSLKSCDLPDPAMKKAEQYNEECEKQGIVPVSRSVAAKMILNNSASKALRGDRQIAAGCSAGFFDDEPFICLRDADLGDEGTTAIAGRLGNAVLSLDLTGNSIGSRGARALGCARMPNLETLSLSRTNLGDAAMEALCAGLGQRGAMQLVSLTLAENQISRGGRDLGGILASQKRLNLLDLHWNFVTGDGGVGLFEGIEANRVNGGVLGRLDVSWNCLANLKGAKAMSALAQALQAECPMVHLDLSYNGFQLQECRILADAIKNNHTLIGLHLVGNAAGVDSNGFVVPMDTQQKLGIRPTTAPQELVGAVDDATVMQKHITSQERRAIRAGFNRIDADRSGNINTDELHAMMASLGLSASIEEANEIIAKRDTDGNHELDIEEFTSLMESLIRGQRKKDWEGRRNPQMEMQRERSCLEARTSCWICENWQPVEIFWAGEASAVWSFNSLDNYQRATRFTKDATGRFCCRQMLPPGEVHVVLQVDNGVDLVSGFPSMCLESAKSIVLRRADELPQGDSLTAIVTEVSVLRLAGINKNTRRKRGSICGPNTDGPPVRAVIIDDPDNPGGICVAPRITEAEFFERQGPTKGPWKFSDSIFAQWKFETASLYSQAFSADWWLTKVTRFMKDPLDIEAVGNALQGHYSQFLHIYRRCAAWSSDGSATFGVGMNACAEMLIAAGIVDDHYCRLADIDTMFIAARVREKSGDSQHQFATKVGDTLLRYQFLEFLVRIALARFQKNKEVASAAEAIELLFTRLSAHMLPATKSLYELHSVFHTEACDAVLRDYESFLHFLYRNNSGLWAKPGEARRMCCKEFETILQDADAHNETFPVRDVPYAFLLGMQLYRDELYSLDFFQMSFVEFIHGLGAAVYLRQDKGSFSENLRKFVSNIADVQYAKGLLKTLKPCSSRGLLDTLKPC